MTDIEIGRIQAARQILSFIEMICFSDEYVDFRCNYGSHGVRNAIINMIKTEFNVR